MESAMLNAGKLLAKELIFVLSVMNGVNTNK